ncbi:iron uptake system protein EfeO [Variovorax boronicumulans]|uniref:iron uptake system protein EfeO n=1 Tax=Variovorax boronicumulans TaxID=436515 RepID=UPI000BB2D8F3|nr:iron uptake system protein EfeO [Variovorax boronicumulans]PBI83671.1 Iron uptake system component EfeO precursor [Variovorax boronicumulans]
MTVQFRRRFLAAFVAGFAGLYAVGAQAAVSPLELVGPISDYKIYVTQNVRKLAADVRVFTVAVKAGDIEKAKKLYAPTRTSYERVEPVAELFTDLDQSIDSRADDHEKAEKDPAFIGFHRIEYSLWTLKSTKGLNPVADKLLADVLELQKRLGALTFPPEKVVGGAAVLMEEVAATKISGEENRYSHTDLWDFQSNFEGAYKIVELLRPLVVKQDKPFAEKADANFKVVFDTLAKYRTADGGFETYSKLTERDRKMLAGRVNTLAEDLSKLRGMLGLN